MIGSTDYEQSLALLASRTFWGQRLDIGLRDAILAASLHLPPQELLAGWNQPLPVIIMLHGLGGNRNEVSGNFIKAAATFALRKFAVLRFDFRGCGETGGTTGSISLAKQIDDTGHVIEFVRTDLARMQDIPPLDTTRITLFGLSMGGLTAAAILGRRADICAAVLWQPVFDLMATMTRMFGPLSPTKIRARGSFQAGMLELSPEFFECLENFSIVREVRSFDGPVLIVEGRKDQVIDPSSVNDWTAAFKLADVTVKWVEGADHAFTKDIWAWKAIGETAIWLEDKLHGAR
jgi:pimeloyl-ACP methyl ester carboxylesterase